MIEVVHEPKYPEDLPEYKKWLKTQSLNTLWNMYNSVNYDLAQADKDLKSLESLKQAITSQYNKTARKEGKQIGIRTTIDEVHVVTAEEFVEKANQVIKEQTEFLKRLRNRGN